VALLGRVEFARFAVTYSLTEIPLMLAAVAVFRRWQALARAPQPEPASGVSAS
jgi:ACR3 family arsenite efflux pump ArsB